MKPVIKPGVLAYLDTFNGLIPCKVVSVSGNSQGNICAPSPEVQVKLTATRGAYRKGEIVTSTGFHVIPRECRVKRGCHYRINTVYDIQTQADCSDPWHDNPTGQPGWKCPTCKA